MRRWRREAGGGWEGSEVGGVRFGAVPDVAGSVRYRSGRFDTILRETIV